MLPAGTIIDERYEVISELGQGAFGAVYKCKQTQLDRMVAVKILKTALLQEHDGLARFEREARTISALKHKNIVGFYGFGVWGKAPYMVMELVDGVPLSDLITENGMDCLRAILLMKQVFEALGAAHATGAVHRDLKPSNIIIADAGTANEQVKIIDFGLVKLMPGYGISGQKLTETGYALGTCNYMAPEQALGGQVDRRADIYSGGCILYELLCGRKPFDADDNVAIMFRHINETAAPIRAMTAPDDGYARAVECIVENCLVKDPSKRYQTCEEIIADMGLLEKGRTGNVAPRAVPKNRKNGRPISRRSLVAAAGFLGTILAAGIWFARPQGDLRSIGPTSQQVLRTYHREASMVYGPEWYKSERRHLLLKQIVLLNERDHLLTQSEHLDCVGGLLFCETHDPKAKTTDRKTVDNCFKILDKAFEDGTAQTAGLSEWVHIQTYEKWHGTEKAMARKEHFLSRNYAPSVAYEVAGSLANAGQYQIALKNLESVLNHQDEMETLNRGGCFVLAADLNMMLRRPTEAARLYKLISEYPQLTGECQRAHTGLAFIAFQKRDYRTALSQVNEVIALCPPTLEYCSNAPYDAYLIGLASSAVLHDERQFVRLKTEMLQIMPGLFWQQVHSYGEEQEIAARTLLKQLGRGKDLDEIDAALKKVAQQRRRELNRVKQAT